MLMVMIYIFLTVLGLALGSFINAFVWRLYKQSRVKGSKKKQEYSIIQGRSMCPNCKHVLSAGDLVPVFSWVWLRGRCRYCKKPISAQYPAIEVLAALLIVLGYFYWPFDLIRISDYFIFGVGTILVVLGLSMSIIDTKWQILPTKLVYLMGLAAGFYVLLTSFSKTDSGVLIDSLIGAVVLFGSFWVLYQVSGGKWIGGGDVRLLFVIGLLLGWQKGLLAVVVASYLATIVVVVLIALRRYKKKMRIPFGPFLLLATYGIFLFGDSMISAYKSFSGL
jgi:prepilin signal peptidase PulO-like enzyme (type II secretory pathway)